MAKVQILMCNNEPAQTEHKLQAPPSPQSWNLHSEIQISTFMKIFEPKRVELGCKNWTQFLVYHTRNGGLAFILFPHFILSKPQLICPLDFLLLSASVFGSLEH